MALSGGDGISGGSLKSISPVLECIGESRYTLVMLGKWFSLTYLGTQTKESNIYVSKRIANPNFK